MFGAVLILLGLFLWFALVFNGSVGGKFVNYSFFFSGLVIIIFGFSKLTIGSNYVSFPLGLISIILYLPMVWERFNSCETDIEGLKFDVFIILFILMNMIFKPNKIVCD